MESEAWIGSWADCFASTAPSSAVSSDAVKRQEGGMWSVPRAREAQTPELGI